MSASASRNAFYDVPTDIVLGIYSWMSPVDVARSRLISKAWDTETSRRLSFSTLKYRERATLPVLVKMNGASMDPEIARDIWLRRWGSLKPQRLIFEGKPSKHGVSAKKWDSVLTYKQAGRTKPEGFYFESVAPSADSQGLWVAVSVQGVEKIFPELLSVQTIRLPSSHLEQNHLGLSHSGLPAYLESVMTRSVKSGPLQRLEYDFSEVLPNHSLVQHLLKHARNTDVILTGCRFDIMSSFPQTSARSIEINLGGLISPLRASFNRTIVQALHYVSTAQKQNSEACLTVRIRLKKGAIPQDASGALIPPWGTRWKDANEPNSSLQVQLMLPDKKTSLVILPIGDSEEEHIQRQTKHMQLWRDEFEETHFS